ncbi:CopG family transcriptional regulator [Bifidobacterium crudilactis]|uniref:CopG family transcriptional regulator n=1 Tax=Bifidobacterium crudilactis TaxID=327277 RepID=UPI002649E78B|nr:CopG family transcriptional regulator [Bifidobacterium crudilactis]MDN5973535.1 CopG family transcriptional regulator [Bifidobacterium crudilactis]MDN6271672.1 CopG family transcriptional regulator [Bifidobacterium crudilactis]MDN6459005.1 CopG family transcriptional regulator [Bifidobacterium crudilactis]MDN6773422.1 CopG family transcriptional regulator [Bifidobacterium crudilactis]
MSKLTEQELRDLTSWAESDGPADSGVTLSEDDADRAAQRILRMVGRPSLGHRQATGEGSSPRRQVRLPHTLNHELDEYARCERTTASEVIRLAVSEYLHHHKPDLANAEA